MPQYEYRCSAGHTTSLWRAIDERDGVVRCRWGADEPTADIECGLVMMRVMARPSLHSDDGNMPGGLGGSGDGYFTDGKGGRSDPKKSSEFAKRRDADGQS